MKRQIEPTARPSGGDTKRRRVWFDPRFAIGIALVILSVAGVSGVVSAAATSTQVLVARDTIVPGQRVTLGDLVVANVRAAALTRLYLRSADVPSAGVIVTRPVGVGELIPRSAIASVAGSELRSVVVPAEGALAAEVQPGARVDLWAADKSTGSTDDDAPASGGYDAPTVLVSSAIVVRVIDQKGLVQTGSGSSVELLVPSASTADVLDAIANEASLSVVPVDLPPGH